MPNARPLPPKPGRALLSHAIDYAGLFPPAALDLPTTVRNYDIYRSEQQAWALGPLVLPAGKIVPFTNAWPEFAADWPLSLLLGADIAAELQLARDHGLVCDVVECKVMQPEQIAAIRDQLPEAATVYFEVPTSTDPEEFIAAIAALGACAKIRTGGVTRGAIPPAADVARFLAACVRHQVPFKATAGLHHAIREVYPLTYEPRSESGLMHGFVNVILATTLLADGGGSADAIHMLEETSPSHFICDEEDIRWHNWSFSVEQVVRVRQSLLRSFGSCSFTEPLGELEQMGWL
jgi:hypothetical protein